MIAKIHGGVYAAPEISVIVINSQEVLCSSTNPMEVDPEKSLD